MDHATHFMDPRVTPNGEGLILNFDIPLPGSCALVTRSLRLLLEGQDIRQRDIGMINQTYQLEGCSLPATYRMRRVFDDSLEDDPRVDTFTIVAPEIKIEVLLNRSDLKGRLFYNSVACDHPLLRDFIQPVLDQPGAKEAPLVGNSIKVLSGSLWYPKGKIVN